MKAEKMTPAKGLQKMELRDAKKCDGKQLKACEKGEVKKECCKKEGAKNCEMKAQGEHKCAHKSPCCKEGACKMDGSCGKEKCKPGSDKCCK